LSGKRSRECREDQKDKNKEGNGTLGGESDGEKNKVERGNKGSRYNVKARIREGRGKKEKGARSTTLRVRVKKRRPRAKKKIYFSMKKGKTT